MDAFNSIFSLIIFALVVFIISRIANHFKESRKKLFEIDKKLDEIKEMVVSEIRKK